MSGQGDLDARATACEIVMPGGIGGLSVEAHEKHAEGRRQGGQEWAEQLGHEGYVEMGKKGGSATTKKSSVEAAAAVDCDINESNFTK